MLLTLVKCYGPKSYGFSALVIMDAVVVDVFWPNLDRNLALLVIKVVVFCPKLDQNRALLVITVVVFWPNLDQNRALLLITVVVFWTKLTKIVHSFCRRDTEKCYEGS